MIGRLALDSKEGSLVLNMIFALANFEMTLVTPSSTTRRAQDTYGTVFAASTKLPKKPENLRAV
jgi:hypothetical protein